MEDVPKSRSTVKSICPEVKKGLFQGTGLGAEKFGEIADSLQGSSIQAREILYHENSLL